MRIDVSGQQFVFPNQCACCSRSADRTWTVSASRSRGKRVVHTTAREWDFPYCGDCIDHVLEYRRATTRGWMIFIPGAIVAAMIGNTLGWVLLVISGVLAIVVVRRTRQAAAGMTTGQCASVDCAVVYYGFNGTVNSFGIAPTYAAAFAIANYKKLVNETREVRALIEAALPTSSLRQTQRARRFES